MINNPSNPIPQNPEGIKFKCRDGTIEMLESYKETGIHIGINFGYAYFDKARSPIMGNYVFSEEEFNDKDIVGTEQ